MIAPVPAKSQRMAPTAPHPAAGRRRRASRHSAWRCSVLALLALTLGAADGPGLGNLTYGPGEVGTVIATFTGGNGAPRGHGNVLLLRGYLVVVFSDDGGGGGTSGGFAVYDIANPRSPTLKLTTSGNPAYGHAANIREPHSLPVRGDIVCLPTNGGAFTGLSFWDFANPLAPVRIGTLALPGLSGGDYSGTPWWVSWQGRYVYVAGTGSGLYVVDAADPAAPVLATLRNGKTNPIPTSRLGGFSVNTVNAVGGIMSLTSSNSQPGIAMVDIADPLDPVLRWSTTGAHVGYSAVINGGRLYSARDPVQIRSLADPWSPTLLGTAPDVATNGGYGFVQDRFFFLGSSNRALKVDAGTPTAPTIALQLLPSGFAKPDWDFCQPLGNLAFCGNDHTSGSALMPHQAAPDTAPPEVNMAVPAHGTTGVDVRIRVGLTLTDQLDHRSVTATNVILRPVGGSALATWIAFQHGILSVHPQAELQPGTQYEIVLPAGGVRDLVGNALAATFTARFTTAGASTPVTAAFAAPAPVALGTPMGFTGSGTGAGALQYRWDFGDGTSTAFSSSASASRTYAAPGHYPVTLTVRDATLTTASATRQVLVHRPLTAQLPTASGTVLLAGGRVWCVNPDSGTVAAIDVPAHVRAFEVAVGGTPRALARAGDGTIWVACAGDDTVRVLSPATGAQLASIVLPWGSAPAGIAITPDGGTAYVACQQAGTLVRIATGTRAVTGTLAVAPQLRGVAISADGARILCTRFLSPDTRGEVIEVAASTFSVARTIALAIDATPDAEDAGRGLPNHLAHIAISPDGVRAAVPAKKDNLQRGLRRDGLPLTFENTVRTIVTQLDLGLNNEAAGTRRDLNDRDSAAAVAWSPRGDWLFVAVQGSNTVEVIDAYSGARVLSLSGMGRAPQGLTVSPDGTRLYVQCFMSRSLRIHDIAALTAGTATTAPLVAEVATIASEPLSAQVLAGKRVFYNAGDRRMSQDGYISCASCHLDGGHDGRVWDFSDRGEGLRATTDLRGRRGTGHGRVHWSANFDEIQDFEHDIRGPFGGTGFMSDAQFATGTRGTPLGDAKAGVAADLDALAAYVSSLATTGRSPRRTASGALSADAIAGKLVFQRLDCASCHEGPDFTDSAKGVLHDVGTLRATSGQRLGGPLPGIDTPTLRGLWHGAPYLHDGSAATLLEVLTTRNAQDRHGVTSGLSATERNQLVAYLGSIDDAEAARPVVALTLAAITATATESGSPGSITITRSGSTADALAVLLQAGGTATPGADWVAPPSYVVIPAGQASVVVMVTPVQDTVSESAETATLTLLANGAYTLPAIPSASVTIIDDENAAPVITTPAAASTTVLVLP